MQKLLKTDIFSAILLSILFLFCSCSSGADKTKGEDANDKETMVVPTDKKWSERMALSIMHRNEFAFQIDGKEKPKWDYVHGLVMRAFEQLYYETNDEKYYNYVKEYADTLIDNEGDIIGYKLKDYNIDMVNAGVILFDLYEKTNDERYKKAIDLLRLQIEDQPRTNSGGFWHKKRYPFQMWLDGLYMGEPFYLRYTLNFEDGENLDDIVHQFDQIQQHSLDKETGLLYHGWDESKNQKWADNETGTSPHFWSRALGWYAMALVDVLEYFPKDHPKYKTLVGYMQNLAEAVSSYQHESGLWYQVVDQGNREGNYLEASGTSMFAYAFSKGANAGYLDQKYMAVAEKAFDGLVNELIKVDDKGVVTITEVCAVAGLGGDPYRDGSYEYYINERKKDNDPKATGPFIMAALEMDK